MKLIDKAHEIGIICVSSGGLAQLARAVGSQSTGRRFEPDILHKYSKRRKAALRRLFHQKRPSGSGEKSVHFRHPFADDDVLRTFWLTLTAADTR